VKLINKRKKNREDIINSKDWLINFILVKLINKRKKNSEDIINSEDWVIN
jgi:hypothetical protein